MAPAKRQLSLVAVGDSKTVGGAFDWKPMLSTLYSIDGVVVTMNMMAVSGWKTQDAKNNVDAWIAANGSIPAPSFVLYTLGTNDPVDVDETTWKSNTAYIWDAFRTKWPSVQVKYVRVPLGAFGQVGPGLQASWQDALAATRPWATPARDENEYLFCPDFLWDCAGSAVHENTAGCQLVAAQWHTDLAWLP